MQTVKTNLKARADVQPALPDRRVSALLWKIMKYLSLVAGAFTVLLPLIVIVFSAFKTKEEYNLTSRLALPESFLHLDNFVRVFEAGGLGIAFKNTITIIGLAVIGNVIIGTMVAYALSRFDFKLKKLILGAYLVATLIPLVTTQVSTFGIVSNLGLVNTIWAPILLYLGADVVMIYIYIQFIDTIPMELDEAAMLEGASYFKIYRSIIFPMLAPATATVVIIKTINIYNDFYIPFLYMPGEDMGVVSTVAYKFMGPLGAEWNVICAGVLIVLIPTIVLFLFLQKHIYEGISNGAVK
ncbi:carbohydrate ABC transporter permease [Ectobacillus sp. JY-23]|uniref:carbohydrate ABC transporter permease n=1 Tax=Ectobacillus sp. JY-23 TaxID=2933872 RepID=UPI001FF5F910|nr:carbohydrate ABC transporter permease [Ectobacillus sp. JY-23]UOY92239.1 carbohydrate ABC transporter permease [Ectobacillus sp. JY-23]